MYKCTDLHGAYGIDMPGTALSRKCGKKIIYINLKYWKKQNIKELLWSKLLGNCTGYS